MYKNYTRKLGVRARYVHKLLLIMRLTTVILMATIMQVSATGFAQTITLSEKNANLKNLFKEIRKQSNYSFLYTDEQLHDAKNVTINVTAANLKDVLDQIFKDQPITYTIDEKTVVIKEQEKSLLKQFRAYINAADIRGVVFDENDKPLAGAFVRIEGTAIRSLTNLGGNFFLPNVPPDGNLIVSYVGYTTDTIPVNGKTQFTINLKQQSNIMQGVEIVSTGYQTLSKERATGSFSKPDMKQFQARVSNQDILSRLEGLVTGLMVTSNSRGQKVLIRGQSSISLPTDPLYVVNGVPIDNVNSVNPDDIADVTVLKDAAAAAIWGARAANGVIVITTKSGDRNGKLSISYSGSVNFSGKPDFGYGKMMNSAQYIQTAKELFNPTQFPYATLADGFIAPHEQILYDQYAKYGNTTLDAQATKSLDSLSSINNMDQIKDLWYRDAMNTSHTLSVSGGSNNYSFYTSAGYTNTRSSQIGQSSNNYRFSFNQNWNPIKRLKVSLVTSLGNNVSNSARPIIISNQFLPYQLFQDQTGNNISMPYEQGYSPERWADYQQRSRIDLNYNPLDEINYGYSSSNNINVNMVGDVDLKLIKGLSFHGTYGYQRAPGTNKSYDDSKSYKLRRELLGMTYAPSITSVPVYNLPVDGGTYIVSNNESRSWTLRNQLIYSTLLRSDKDQLNVQFGQEAREQFSTGTSTIIRGYNPDLQTYPALDYYRLSVTGVQTSFPAGRPATISGNNFLATENLTRYTSYFGLINYTIEGKYSIDGSWRIDHSNLFGSDESTQNKPIWSLGGKWNIKKETFMGNVNWIDDLALRGTYGITGNSPYIGAASQYDILSVGGGFSTPYAGQGMFISSPANNKLAWEITQTINLGLDFSLLKSRLDGSIDLYHKNTIDLIGQVQLNPFTSFSGQVGNIGNLRNKGIELHLRSSNIQKQDFGWTTTFNISYNKNKLLSYSAVSSYLNSATGKLSSTYLLGYPLQALFAYQYAGLDNAGNPMIKLADGRVTKDRNVATPADVVYMGTTIPIYSGGLSNSFRYKALTLSGNMIFNLGNVMRRDVNTVYNGRITGVAGAFSGNLNSYFLDRWKKPGDEAFTNIPAYLPAEQSYSSTRDITYYTQGDVNVVSASFVKLRDITLSYSLPAEFLNKIRVKNASFFVQATNFMIWKANKDDIDPEFNDPTSGFRTIPGYSHTFSIGTNINF